MVSNGVAAGRQRSYTPVEKLYFLRKPEQRKLPDWGKASIVRYLLSVNSFKCIFICHRHFTKTDASTVEPHEPIQRSAECCIGSEALEEHHLQTRQLHNRLTRRINLGQREASSALTRAFPDSVTSAPAEGAHKPRAANTSPAISSIFMDCASLATTQGR